MHPAVDPDIRIGRISLEPRVVIYATLIQMTAYAVYQEPDTAFSFDDYASLLRVGVVPMIVIALAHAFSEALDLHVRLGRALNADERWTIVRTNVQFVYVAFLPVVLLAILWLLGVHIKSAVSTVLWIGILSLFAWGVRATVGTDFGWPRRILLGLAYASLGVVVVLLEIVFTH